ncbi:MAG: glycosyltransferase family A protein [Ginsengibacter sp.]
MPRVSIVIPCFNHGKYLPEALHNLESNHAFYEVIIVNDGSTDEETIRALQILKSKNYNVIDQQNGGLAKARNTGISSSRGEFIFFLDADNSIEMDFVTKAVALFDKDPEVAVVYSDAEYFGTKSGEWKVGDFNLQRLMIANYIDACAIIRKSVLDELGGYDEKMKEIKSGWEDWEMWLRISFAGKIFRYLPQKGFRYRVGETSMITGIQSSYEVRNKLTEYLHKKYPAQLGQEFITQFVVQKFKPHPLRFLIKLSMITWFKNKYRKLLDKNKIIAGI